MKNAYNNSDIVHILIRIWKENERICHEVEFAVTRGCRQLHLDIHDGQRPEDDWINEAVNDAINDDIEIFLPDLGNGNTIEICEEPILYEAIGEFSIDGWKDYYGDYDEDYQFDVRLWSVEIDYKNEDTDYV